ncbi:MAG TPA: DUF4178 domain-containing protein [Candidatus Acidoferrum sp.]|jgi:hypothetical protein
MSAGQPPFPPQPPRPPQPSAAPAKPQVKALNCPQCGAAITLRSFQQAVTVVCESCHSILDAKDPALTVLQQFKAATNETRPLIPLGMRGKLRGTDYEVIGFQRRTIFVDGVQYDWHEYLLFNPYKGFRYLSEYQGHWNDISVCKVEPLIEHHLVDRANYLGEYFRHFQTSEATTSFVLGEFPWQVRVAEPVIVMDYVKPPRLLSYEKDKTSGEVTWSIGEYIYGKEIWDSFKLPGKPPVPIGVFENQPAPNTVNLKQIWVVFLLLCVFLVGLMTMSEILASRAPVYDSTYQLGAGAPKGEASFVTDVFELKGRTSDVEIVTKANVSNNWIYLNYALINQDTGRAWDFGREVSYYSGRDSDGSWTEGSRTDTVTVPRVPAGHYYLRIEPEADARHPNISYSVSVRRDVPVLGFFGWGLLILFIPVVLLTFKAISFERSRWAESDHPILKTESD